VIRSARVISDAQAASKAVVEVQGVSACQRCARGQGCGAGIFNQGIQATRLHCFTRVPVLANQTVDIEIEEAGSSWLWLVAGAYGLPLLGLLLASFAASWIMPGLARSQLISESLSEDAVVAVAAILGLAGGVIAWRMLSATVLARLETGLCLNSARIVSNSSSSVTPILESPDET
jgi:positive regulator of sigma E activity